MIKFTNSIKVEDYNRLREEVGWGALPMQQAQNGLNNSNFIVSGEQDGKVVSTARVLWDGGYIAFIADVMVSPDYQKKGIGREMLQMIMDYIKNDTNKEWNIMVVIVAAKGKEGFYKKFGFEERPNEMLGCGMSQWIKR